MYANSNHFSFLPPFLLIAIRRGQVSIGSILNTATLLATKKIPLIITLVLGVTCQNLNAQFDGPPDTPEEYAKQYQWRIAQESLNGVYIPANLDEAMTELDRLTDEESKSSFAALPEDQAFRRLFHSLRLWIVNKWGLNGGSRLSYLFHDLKLKHPDDLAELIIISWHRKLNERPIDMKESITRILEARREAWRLSKEKKNQP